MERSYELLSLRALGELMRPVRVGGGAKGGRCVVLRRLVSKELQGDHTSPFICRGQSIRPGATFKTYALRVTAQRQGLSALYDSGYSSPSLAFQQTDVSNSSISVPKVPPLDHMLKRVGRVPGGRHSPLSLLCSHTARGRLPHIFSPLDSIEPSDNTLGDYNWIESHCARSALAALPYWGPGFYSREICQDLLDNRSSHMDPHHTPLRRQRQDACFLRQATVPGCRAVLGVQRQRSHERSLGLMRRRSRCGMFSHAPRGPGRPGSHRPHRAALPGSDVLQDFIYYTESVWLMHPGDLSIRSVSSSRRLDDGSRRFASSPASLLQGTSSASMSTVSTSTEINRSSRS
jgi:hypothetical protein